MELKGEEIKGKKVRWNMNIIIVDNEMARFKQRGILE